MGRPLLAFSRHDPTKLDDPPGVIRSERAIREEA
jgi:hypothetical protein